MTSPTSTGRKRKRDNGATMPRLRETIDHETGEVYRVETTKQAKRRHQRNGGAPPKPTIGQINAADIWNKQEEKIKKDKEREERRKKHKLKEEAKLARQKGVQQQWLKEGKITVEDTWGKVKASQNRLHKFFGAPKQEKPQTSIIGLPVLQENLESSDEEVEETEVADVNNCHQNLLQGEDVLDVDLESIFTNSPLSPDTSCKKIQHATSAHADGNETVLPNGELHSTQRSHMPSKRKTSQSSQKMMPPPKRPRVLSPSHSKNTSDQSSTVQSNASVVQHPPFREATNVDDAAQAHEHVQPSSSSTCPDNGACYFPVSTQVVRDTLSGLCSQDFEDDFINNDKERNSPAAVRDIRNIENHAKTYSPLSKRLAAGEKSGLPSPNITRSEQEEILALLAEDLDSDGFDNDGIDDDLLLSLAATQQLKRDLFAASKHTHKPRTNSETVKKVSPSKVRNTDHNSPAQVVKLGDSFTMDSLDDEDLLESLNNYEKNCFEYGDEVFNIFNSTNDMTYDAQFTTPVAKKRRALPWIKNPISCSFQDDDQDLELPTSLPASQEVGY